jgi:S-adenosylmethionine:tRNA ribosyltransferase-isomerase
MTNDQKISSYDYYLPPELIAQTPVNPRDTSRLLVIDSPSTHQHSIFANLPDWLLPGDLLILNNTRVIPARLYGRKSTGAIGEVLLVEEKEDNCWLALVKPGKRFPIGSKINFGTISDSNKILLQGTVIDKDPETGGRILTFEFSPSQSFWEILEQLGEIPFPPYVKESTAQPEQYQTVYAQELGAIAAPTAGLHFTPQLLAKLLAKKVKIGYLTLHVGIGTFRPVEVKDITTHKMHQEWIEVNQNTVNLINQTKLAGGRIIAVGTTVVRALEGAFAHSKTGILEPFKGKTDLFIYPGYQFKVIDGLITNFHLPRSSLLMLVGALIGRERLLNLYTEAIAEKYRFYSFGDAMLILPWT